MRRKDELRCPYCGRHAVLRSADGIYKDNSKGEMLYVCANYPECDTYVRVQKGTNKPLGTLANKRLRELRNEAHKNFDKLYKRGYITRRSAYDWLAGLFCMPLKRAHIAQFSEPQCLYVIEQSKKYLEILEKRYKERKKRGAA